MGVLGIIVSKFCFEFIKEQFADMIEIYVLCCVYSMKQTM